jgi:hypothetical protein
MTGSYGSTNGIPYMHIISINSWASPSKAKTYQKDFKVPVNMGRKSENPVCMKDLIFGDGSAQEILTPFYLRQSK